MGKMSLKSMIRLFSGFFIFAISSVLMINAHVGLMPWDVLHQGLSIKLGITIGQASIMVGVVIVILDAVFGENIGWGTLLNMTFIGIFIDLVIFSGVIPHASNTYIGVFMVVIRIILAAIASFLYLGVCLGSGSRDGLMIALQKKTNKSVRLVRTILEILALVVGWLLGDSVGIGTLVSALGLGYVLQIVFRIFKFDTKLLKHRFIIDDIREWKEKKSDEHKCKSSIVIKNEQN